MADGSFTDVPGDTPLTDPPDDYCPDGAGSWFLVPGGRERGKRLFVRDSVHDGDGVTPTDEFEGDLDGVPTVLFVHGNPECSYTYRQVVDRLTADHLPDDDPVRIVAPDHIGFGRSDTANYEMVCMDHARNLRQLVAALDLEDVTMIVHDWGGPIGVGALLREPDRLANLVVLNSTVFPIPEGGRTFDNYPSRLLPWPRVPAIVPDDEWGELAADAIFTEPQGPVGVFTDLFSDLPDQLFGSDADPTFDPPHADAKRVFWKQFANPTNARSSKRLVRQCRYWAEGNVYEEPTLGARDTGPFYDFIQDSIATEWGDGTDRDVGVRMVLGEWDPLAKDAVVEQWCDHLPQLRGNVERFPDRNHFIEEFEPGAVADAIADVAGLD